MIFDVIVSKLETALRNAIEGLYPSLDVVITVQMPTDKKRADFVSNVAFDIAKKSHTPPIKVAQAITSVLSVNDEFLVEAALPGFINFKVSKAHLIATLDYIGREKSLYGSSPLLKGQSWVIEHTSPNPNKAMHVGHLRNNLIGVAVANILSFSGASVVRDCVDNDRGIAIAKAMYGYLMYRRKGQASNSLDSVEFLISSWFSSQANWLHPNDIGMKADHFVGECYELASNDFKKDKKVEEEVRNLALSWEDGDTRVKELWRLILSFAHQGIAETLNRLGNSHWDKIWHEHEHYKKGKELINKGLDLGVFKKLDDGAVLTHLKDYKLPDTIVLKSDGTSLYITQDIALTELKKVTYKADRLLWVVGPEQATAMKQVFAICEQLGIGEYSNFTHLSYGLVSISERGVRKKMSSRNGGVLLIDTLLDEVRDAILDSGRNYDFAKADKIAVAAVKFAILKPARNTDVAIDVTQAINLEGDSGIYVLYTIARIRAVLHTAGLRISQDLRSAYCFTLEEHDHIMQLAYFPQFIQTALSHYSPNTLVEYSLIVAHSFNAIYASDRFLTDNNIETSKKLELAMATLIVLENVMGLLGIESVEKI